MHPRQAALLTTAARLVEAIAFPREFHLPKEVRGTEPYNPEGTDLYVWKYDMPYAGGVTKPCAIAFVGKQNKPLWHSHFRDEARRDEAIEQEAQRRRAVMLEKLQRQQARKDFQHTLVVDDILYSSWGYDQTNVNFYQVVEARGKEVVLREIGSRIVKSGGGYDKVMAEPNEFVGPPLRKRPQGTGTNVYVKIDSSQIAHEWDGSPLSQTDAYSGH